mmetsp:Transcript_55826/g.107712  ORF Transcript_55826/g.107712 Transcript_55826/m.107712 type:complete len:93 (+) Transcript_55826:360-638(+)
MTSAPVTPAKATLVSGCSDHHEILVGSSVGQGGSFSQAVLATAWKVAWAQASCSIVLSGCETGPHRTLPKRKETSWKWKCSVLVEGSGLYFH